MGLDPASKPIVIEGVRCGSAPKPDFGAVLKGAPLGPAGRGCRSSKFVPPDAGAGNSAR